MGILTGVKGGYAEKQMDYSLKYYKVHLYSRPDKIDKGCKYKVGVLRSRVGQQAGTFRPAPKYPCRWLLPVLLST